MEGLFCYIFVCGDSISNFYKKRADMESAPTLRIAPYISFALSVAYGASSPKVGAITRFLSQIFTKKTGGYAIPCPQFNRREQAPALRYGKHFAGVHKKVGEGSPLPHNMFCINIAISNSFSPIQMPQRCSPFVILSVAHRDSTRLYLVLLGAPKVRQAQNDTLRCRWAQSKSKCNEDQRTQSVVWDLGEQTTISNFCLPIQTPRGRHGGWKVV